MGQTRIALIGGAAFFVLWHMGAMRGGLLEGFGVAPFGRFAILFGLWAFVASFALQSQAGDKAYG